MLYFQKLDVYQRSIELLVLAHRVRERLPRGHADLADQLRRAAQSVPQNIAEGCGRTTRADKAKHSTIARGSAMESASHLDFMPVDELIDAELYARGTELLERIVAMRMKRIDPCLKRVHGVDRAHGVVPVHERGHGATRQCWSERNEAMR